MKFTPSISDGSAVGTHRLGSYGMKRRSFLGTVAAVFAGSQVSVEAKPSKLGPVQFKPLTPDQVHELWANVAAQHSLCEIVASETLKRSFSLLQL